MHTHFFFFGTFIFVRTFTDKMHYLFPWPNINLLRTSPPKYFKQPIEGQSGKKKELVTFSTRPQFQGLKQIFNQVQTERKEKKGGKYILKNNPGTSLYKIQKWRLYIRCTHINNSTNISNPAENKLWKKCRRGKCSEKHSCTELTISFHSKKDKCDRKALRSRGEWSMLHLSSCYENKLNI